MNLTPYKTFGKIRLKKFCPDDDLYDEDWDEHGEFIKEEIRGAWFARWKKRPKELVLATITLYDCSTEFAPDFFAAIGLELEKGLTRQETDARLGTPHWQRDDGDYVIYRTNGDFPYEISCGFTNDMKLCQVTVRRLDIELPDND
jgi:hypothetical protein